jgi:hypothetical protein
MFSILSSDVPGLIPEWLYLCASGGANNTMLSFLPEILLW